MVRCETVQDALYKVLKGMLRSQDFCPRCSEHDKWTDEIWNII